MYRIVSYETLGFIIELFLAYSFRFVPDYRRKLRSIIVTLDASEAMGGRFPCDHVPIDITLSEKKDRLRFICTTNVLIAAVRVS